MEHFRLNRLSFDKFSKFEITPLLYFNGAPPPHFFLTQIKTIPIQISFIHFSKFHKFVFLNRNIVRKVAFSPIYFIQKRLYWTHILRSPQFHINQGEVCFLSHKYTRNTMNITYANFFLKITEPIFQTATSWGLLKVIKYQFHS